MTMRKTAHLMPSLLVLVLAVFPHEPELAGQACLTDGPQFACWLTQPITGNQGVRLPALNL